MTSYGKWYSVDVKYVKTMLSDNKKLIKYDCKVIRANSKKDAIGKVKQLIQSETYGLGRISTIEFKELIANEIKNK